MKKTDLRPGYTSLRVYMEDGDGHVQYVIDVKSVVRRDLRKRPRTEFDFRVDWYKSLVAIEPRKIGANSKTTLQGAIDAARKLISKHSKRRSV